MVHPNLFSSARQLHDLHTSIIETINALISSKSLTFITVLGPKYLDISDTEEEE